MSIWGDGRSFGNAATRGALVSGLALAAAFAACRRDTQETQHAAGSGYGVGRSAPAEMIAEPDRPARAIENRRPQENTTYVPGQQPPGRRDAGAGDAGVPDAAPPAEPPAR